MDKIWPVIKFCLYTVAYLFGKRNAVLEMENKSNKKALDESTKVLVDGEKIREKYRKTRATIPNSWDELRKANKN